MPPVDRRGWAVIAAAGLIGVLGAWLGAAPASAAELSFSRDALPGSTFQGADGDQEETATLRDWETLQADGLLRHSEDPNSPDSAFGDGTKELEPGEWFFTDEGNGVSPAKANILDGWSAVTQPGGNTFLYLGFTREMEGGTTSLNFELNHDGELWRNPRGAMVPCRRTGDLLVSFLPHGNGLAVVLYRWVTTTAATGGRPCALEGEVRPFANFPAGAAQGWMNEDPITNRLPGGFHDVGDQIGQGEFGEAALNLTRLLPDALGDRCVAFASIWMHSRASDELGSRMKDYVAPRPLTVRTCSASGTKFFDSNANGQRDDGERGIPNFKIWADYPPFNGIHDNGEPSSVTDNQGQYVINDIKPGGDGSYRLRETLLSGPSRLRRVSNDWVCSYPTTTAPNGRFPCAWELNVNNTPYARGRDFGNWFPAQITVKKYLFPPGDPGQFDLLVGDEVVLNFPGGGSSATILVPPGTYDVSEVAAGSTDLADYQSSVTCAQSVTRRGRLRDGVVYTGLELSAGQQATCTFYNIRPGSPAIAIRKTGPAIAEAGDTLTYNLYVTNPGSVPFAAADVVVTDPDCNNAPERVDTDGDSTPGILDPGDTWTYRCSRRTPAGGADCEPTRLDNTGEVRATANGVPVGPVSDTIDTIILCPDQPAPPIPEPPGPPGPGPPEPGPVVPPGPTPPDAGSAGRAALLFEHAIRGCIRGRVPRINLRGTRISRVRVYVNGDLRRRLTVESLQRRVTPRVTLAPGRYRIAARVNFQNGSGTSPVTLRGTVEICGAQARRAPAVTG